MTWKRQVEGRTNQIGLKREDAIDRVKWRNGVYKLSRSTRGIQPPALTQTKPDFKNLISLSLSLLLETMRTAQQMKNTYNFHQVKSHTEGQ